MKNTLKALHTVQKNLRIGKNQKNDFGGFKYRTAEDICTAVNEILPENCVVITDAEISESGLITATAKFYCLEDEKEDCIIAHAFAYLDASDSRKKMSKEQICGAGISYARKYALCNLFNIGTGEIDPDELPPKQDSAVEKENMKKVAQRAKIALMKLDTPSAINDKVKEMTAQLPKYKAVIENVAISVIKELDALNEQNEQAAQSHSEE